jgi:hypothetical protein
VRFLEEAYDKERDDRLHKFEASKVKPAIRSRVFDAMKRRVQEGTPKPAGELMTVKDLPPADYRRRKFKYPKREDYLRDGETLPPGIDIHLDTRPVHQTRLLKDFQGERKRLLDLALMPTMLPPSPSVKRTLYDGISHHGMGRYHYLHTRYIDNPEEKFPFPVQSSQDYGWRLQDVIRAEDIHKPDYGRTRIVSDTFYRRSGVPGLCIPAIY